MSILALTLATMSTQAADLSEAVRAILKALAELSSAQTTADLDPERDHAMHKAVAAFRIRLFRPVQCFWQRHHDTHSTRRRFLEFERSAIKFGKLAGDR
jgi:hypothetical protein